MKIVTLVICVIFLFSCKNENKNKSQVSNVNHPEKRNSEVFLTNIASDTGWVFEPMYKLVDDPSGLVMKIVDTLVYIKKIEEREGYTSIGWKTKRLGKIAYDIDGKPLRGFLPVFVKINEIKKREDGKTILKDLRSN